MAKATGMSETDYKKTLSRNDELVKQETTLKKEYTTLLRKISSICTVLEHLEANDEKQEEEEEEASAENPGLVSSRSLKRVPGLQWYNDQINAVEKLWQENQEITIPAELLDSYKLYKDAPLLHRDVQ